MITYEAFKQNIQDELRIVSQADMKDLKTITFEKFLLELRSKKRQLSNLEVERICELQGFMNNGKPTIAGLLLFSEYPQEFFPQLSIIAVSIPGDKISNTGAVGERFLDNARIEGNIGTMLEEALSFVRRNIRTNTIINPITGAREDKSEYPIIAIRELLINALVHRDYSVFTQNTPISIRIFQNRIEIENPGGLYGRMTLDQLGNISADTRNPRLANALEIFNLTENRYSGIPTIISAMEEYKLPRPVFEDISGNFKVTLYNQRVNDEYANMDDISKRIAQFCIEPKTRQEIEELFKGELSGPYLFKKYVTPLIEMGIIKYTIPDKPKSKL